MGKELCSLPSHLYMYTVQFSNLPVNYTLFRPKRSFISIPYPTINCLKTIPSTHTHFYSMGIPPPSAEPMTRGHRINKNLLMIYMLGKVQVRQTE